MRSQRSRCKTYPKGFRRQSISISAWTSHGHFSRCLGDQPPHPSYPDQPPEATTSFPSWNSAKTAILMPGGRSAPRAESSLPMRCPDFWSPNIPFSRQEKPADQSRSGSSTQRKHAPALQGPHSLRQTDRQTDRHRHTHTHRAISEHVLVATCLSMAALGKKQ